MTAVYRCFGGHVDEARDLMARDRDGLTRAPGTTSMVTVLPSGAWLVSLACPHCGVMFGFSAPPQDAQATIGDWQSHHIPECRGEVLR